MHSQSALSVANKQLQGPLGERDHVHIYIQKEKKKKKKYQLVVSSEKSPVLVVKKKKVAAIAVAL